MSTPQRAVHNGKTVLNFVGGAEIAATSGRGAPLYDPATGQESGWVGFSSAEDVARAVAAAKAAWPAWSETPPAKRAAYLFRFKALLEESREEIAARVSAEHGKTHYMEIGRASCRERV